MLSKDTKIAVVGLGYVGLPLGLALAKKFPRTVGFDINEEKIEKIKSGIDPTKEGLEKDLNSINFEVSCTETVLRGADVYIVVVPTPIDENKQPDLTILESATKIVAKYIREGAIIVFESTVFPSVTEEFCGPILEKESGLKRGKDFFLGYSPERINAGDAKNTLENVVKIISAENEKTLEVLNQMYGAVIKAGVYKAPSIKVAEAAKIIENTQRDLNIALINELAIIFERMNLETKEVLDAASTKWNFLKFTPGLVGGHCIGVDPYYLTAKAKSLGYHPEVILAGRRINDNMGRFVAQKLIKLLIKKEIHIQTAKVGIIGLSFKENVADIRNSRVPDMYNELRSYGLEPIVFDPHACPVESEELYGIKLVDEHTIKQGSFDGLIYAVPHIACEQIDIASAIKSNGVLIDVKSKLNKDAFPNNVKLWSL